MALLAVLSAIFTGALAAVLGGTEGYGDGAVVYVLVAVGALFSPAAITLQVIGGQALVGGLLLGPNPPDLLLLLPLLAGVVATAELLALVARLDTALERDAGGEFEEIGLSALAAGLVFGAVLLTGALLPGPGGILAVVVGAGATVVLSLLLVRSGRETEAAHVPVKASAPREPEERPEGVR
jgi:hypothetical protein